jgi:hypothetical protein
MRYKGQYRLRTEIDRKTNTFPREYTGQFADNDVYIDCHNKGQIFHYGNKILQFYTPSLKRGRNIIKAINEELGERIITNIEESDSEVLFRFNSKYMEQLEPYLKPKTNGADRSPFSTKNLPKTKYIIPDEDLVMYKQIVENIPKNRLIGIVHTTNSFIQSLTTKKNPLDKIKADMALKGLKGKEYIHSICKWDEYIKYLEKNL